MNGSVGLALVQRNREMNRSPKIAWLGVFALVLATGCRQYRTREFVAVQRPVKFEKWRLYVNVRVDAANPSPTNHFYVINAVAWTLPGDVHRGDTNAFLPTAYDASLDSLRLFRIEGAHVAELPLPPLRHGSADQPNRIVQLFHGNGTRVEIPARVRELRADIVMTFRHRETGNTETKVLTTTLLKRERTKLEPVLE